MNSFKSLSQLPKFTRRTRPKRLIHFLPRLPIPSVYLRSGWKHNRTRKQYLNLIQRLQGVLNYEYLICSDHCIGLSSIFWFRCSIQIAKAKNKCSINHTLAEMIIHTSQLQNNPMFCFMCSIHQPLNPLPEDSTLPVEEEPRLLRKAELAFVPRCFKVEHKGTYHWNIALLIRVANADAFLMFPY